MWKAESVRLVCVCYGNWEMPTQSEAATRRAKCVVHLCGTVIIFRETYRAAALRLPAFCSRESARRQIEPREQDAKSSEYSRNYHFSEIIHPILIALDEMNRSRSPLLPARHKLVRIEAPRSTLSKCVRSIMYIKMRSSLCDTPRIQ